MHLRHSVFVTWTISTCDMTLSYMCPASFPCVTWLIPTCAMNASCHVHLPKRWGIPMCDMTHSYVWHEWVLSHSSYRKGRHKKVTEVILRHECVWYYSVFPLFFGMGTVALYSATVPMKKGIHVCASFMCVPHSCVCLIHVCASFMCVPHSCVWYYSVLRVTWMSHVTYMLQEGETFTGREGDLGTDVCDMTHFYVCHEWVTSHTSSKKVRHSNVWHDPFVRVTWMSHVIFMLQKAASHTGHWGNCEIWYGCVWHHSFLRVTWMSHVTYMLQEGETYTGREGDLGTDVCDMTHSYVWHDCVMSHTCCVMSHTCCVMSHTCCVMSHTCCRRVRHTQVILVLMCVTWLIPTCDMNESCHIHVAGGWDIHRLWGDLEVLMCVTWLIPTCDMNESCHIHVAGGWGIHRLWRWSRRTRREPTSR